MLLTCLALLVGAPALPKYALMVDFREAPAISYLVPGGRDHPEYDLMRDALRRRGWNRDEWQSVDTRLSTWELGAIIEKFSGGILYLLGEAKVKSLEDGPVMETRDGTVSFDWIVRRLANKPTLILADVGCNNLLGLNRNENASAIVSTGNWRDTSQTRKTGNFILDHVEFNNIGVLSVALWRALPYATDINDLASRINQHAGTASMAVMWTDLYPVQVRGPGSPLIPGKPINPPTAE